MDRLRTIDLQVAYGGDAPVLDGLGIDVADGAITSIIGPNACGKSTLLRTMARLLDPTGGAVVLDGESVHRKSTKEVARELCILPQHPAAPESITVEDLVLRGRYPHQGMFSSPGTEDRAAVERALELAGVTELRRRAVDELSGGQRQRAWIAMALAQQTHILLLDEPTTFLDIAHQYEVLSLVHRLNREEGRTVVMVLHDLNHAAQFSDHVIAMKEGSIAAAGPPREVVCPALVEQVFGVACQETRVNGTSALMLTPLESKVNGASSPLCGGDVEGVIASGALAAGYGRSAVIREIDISIPRGRITAIIGPNACGKSTLMRVLTASLKPMSGEATLEAKRIDAYSSRDLARRMALLSQGAQVPTGFTVEELVSLGRYPYQRWYRQWSAADKSAVDAALDATGVAELRWRLVETLSGGQRQRAWLAMVLAQRSDLLMLDEPTTFLDIAHQVEVLELARTLNVRDGKTVVMILHDLAQACRYADQVIAMKDGRVVAAGEPSAVVNESLVREVFGIGCTVVEDSRSGRPIVIPDSTVREEPAESRRFGRMILAR